MRLCVCVYAQLIETNRINISSTHLLAVLCCFTHLVQVSEQNLSQGIEGVIRYFRDIEVQRCSCHTSFCYFEGVFDVPAAAIAAAHDTLLLEGVATVLRRHCPARYGSAVVL